MSSSSTLRAGLAALVLVVTLRPAEALVISEIMYHSADAEEKRFEFVELYNENPDPLDLSGFSLCNGVEFEFPQGTWLNGYEIVVVCADVVAIRDKYGITNVLGGWLREDGTPALSNGGEAVEVCNSAGIEIIKVRYNDRGNWPAAADGTGHSLEIVAPYDEVDDPDNWMASNSIGGTPGLPNPCWGEVAAAPSGGPVGEWSDSADIGGPCGAGSTAFSTTGDRYTIEGGGDDIWQNGDQFHFAYVEIEGNFDVRARVISRSWADRWGKAGLMARQDLSSQSRYAFVHDSPADDAARFAGRPTHGGDDNFESGTGDAGLHPNWYRIVRQGNTIIGFAGGNGEDWTELGSMAWTGESVFVGLALTSHSGCTTARLIWDNLEITGTVIPPDDDGPVDDPAVCVARVPVVINEALTRTAGERWFELYNDGKSSVDLTGYHITDDVTDLAKATLPDGTSIAPGDFVTFTEAELGLDLSLPDVWLGLSEPGAVRVVDAVSLRPNYDEFSEARLPDGGDELDDAATPTRGAANQSGANDTVVINEIMYHPIDGNEDREFVEIHNAGADSVNLTEWSFSNGISFDFPSGTTIPAGGYLVVARAPEFIASVYNLDPAIVLGPQSEAARDAFGRLADSGERLTLSDEFNRTVDTVRYHDGGQWSRWPDGLGSSLERIDANQPASAAQAWDASDDAAKAETKRYAYVGRHVGGESELHLLLSGRGITQVDNVSVRSGAVSFDDRKFVRAGDVWRYFKGNIAPPADWFEPDFDDTSWLQGPTGIGYGDGNDATILTDMEDNYLTVFCRRRFDVTDIEAIDQLVLDIEIDDGYFAYLNGALIATYNVGDSAYDAEATRSFENRQITKRRRRVQTPSFKRRKCSRHPGSQCESRQLRSDVRTRTR